MTEPHGLILGFDPGGEGKATSPGTFGWCICSTRNGTLQPPLETGLAKNAWDALRQVTEALQRHYPTRQPPVLAAGIDAPLFWNPQGKRTVDSYLKQVLKSSSMANSVMHINSLPGACLAQGLLLGRHLREIWDFPITEAHPTVCYICCAVRGCLIQRPKWLSTQSLDWLTTKGTPRSPLLRHGQCYTSHHSGTTFTPRNTAPFN